MLLIRECSIVLVVAACATAPGISPPSMPATTATQAPSTLPVAASATNVDPVGFYDFTADVDGQSVPGVMEITRGENGYGGTIAASGQPTLTIRSLTVSGSTVRLAAEGEGLSLDLGLEFSGSSIAGKWSLASGESGTLTATKREPSR